VTIRIEREGDIAVVVIDNPPVNASSHAVREGLLRAVGETEDDDSVRAVVLIGAGRAFMGGADIREFDRPLGEPQMPAVIASIMDSARPWVAAMHGAALGGGLELALACDVRLASPGTMVGLPEVTLGIIPGAGGTQHLPRIVGVARAIDLICSGRRLTAAEAASLGIVDFVVEGELRPAAVEQARRMEGKRRLRDRDVPPGDNEAIEAAERAARAANPARQVAAAIESIRASATAHYATALARERAVFQELRASPAAAELRRRFFESRSAAKGAPR
jgi:3-hydroxyacyl-CoA dehydrogenase